MARIFISHSPTDVSFAKQIARDLVELGANVWLDASDLPSGGRWHNDLNIGFELCDAMVVLLSSLAVAERRVLNDWNTYFQRKKPVILVAVDTPDRLGIHLEPGQYVDFAQQIYETGMRQLIETLRYWGTLPAAQPAAPVPALLQEEATIRSQPVMQPTRSETVIAGTESTPERVTIDQETSVVPTSASFTSSRYLLPAAIGLLLAILVCGGLVIFVLLPQAERANQEATAAAATQVALAYDEMTQIAFATVSAGTQIAQSTQVALGQAQEEQALAQTATALAPTLVYAATATAQAAAVQDAFASAATLSALQTTLSAQQAADRGVPPATPPTSNRFANQSLIFNLQRE
ncbi:MAG: toll/interleukin-1 receptor domain-containing protein, partial [Anaerolineae bacterium]|nr:toll/interleukin-1 receptor domain-containing protein [Anaerolineae bacterium]